MPIPDFDHNYVLPPHLGDPTNITHISPYQSSSLEFCQKFATSPYRIQILKNLIIFRGIMTKLGIVNGFQWVDGSFLQDIEALEIRPPSDLDIVTFFEGLSIYDQSVINSHFPAFFDFTLSKPHFLLDHYTVSLNLRPEVIVRHTTYWIQLFSHNRLGVWKGMVQLQLNTPAEDIDALNYLNSIIP